MLKYIKKQVEYCMENILRYDSPAKIFEQALPIGNGMLGAMIYGDACVDRISLNNDTLWSGMPGQEFRDGQYESYKKAQKLVLEGKVIEAQKEIEENFTGRWLNSYLPLGNIYLKREDNKADYSKYERTLNLEKSLVNISYYQDETKIEKEYFISYPDDCLCLRVESTSPVSYTLSGNCVGKSSVDSGVDTLYFSGECPTSIGPSYSPKFKPITYNGCGVKVSAVAKVQTDGTCDWGGDHLKIENATRITIYFCSVTSFVAFNKLPNKETFNSCQKKIEKIVSKGYEKIREDHIKDVKRLYNRVRVNFGGKRTKLTTDKRLLAEEKDISLCELLYNFGRYLIIASSRKGSKATNLQGIWNESMYPAWSSNYTVNINTEMNYWPALMNDLCECQFPVIDLVKNISINGRETAKKLYNADGFCSHHNVDLWANTTPVGNRVEGSARYAFWNLSSGWLCRNLYEYYEYTLDKKFLEKTAYPIMIEAAKFYLSVLQEYKGKWILTPSTSPEHAYILGGKAVSVALYTTMTQSIIEDLFTNVLKAATILGIDDKYTKEIKSKLPDIGIYKIGSKGQLLEYNEEYQDEDVHHRHVSHLYAMYPGDKITTDSSKELSDAVRQSLEIRGDESTGWSMGWKVNLWSKLKDGDRALKLVKTQLTYVDPENKNVWAGGGTYANMFDAHPPFQIDGNFGVTSGIAQMFVQSEDNMIKILPALPSEIKNGYVHGILAKGNIKVNIDFKDSKLTKLTLKSKYAQSVKVKYDSKIIDVKLEANKTKVVK